ncbi:kinase-like domain-containing protein [Kockovaella imperatae]|uniref:Kinase-like domain-containing protein n=1 Tax=Kockovaella imperatae TaxID=4999 RepID=A0A1Y1UDX8_9TREE|nr:kinase-like domain-containing protein [Kockovaella imperatae]ORX36251.1 kinase-like domain-containing protein [Kockovaella imperatae]
MGLRSDMRNHLLPQPPSFKKKKEYSLEQVLGRGGFGKVVQANWSPPGGEKKQVALKVISKRLLREGSTNVMDEINVLKDLDHPNIVHVWDHFESRDKYYIAFELAVGGELFDRIQEKGKFTEKNAVDCIKQVLSATAYLHAHNIVHRDLKPENILYKTRSEHSPIVIADFGIAKHLETPDEMIDDLAGSLGYAAPEVLKGTGHGFKVDSWSIGVIAYTLLCGYSPWRAEDRSELVEETTRGKITFHERFWKKVSASAKDFIRQLLKVDPKERCSPSEALQHPWITSTEATEHDLVPAIRENFNARAKWGKALKVINASNRMRALTPSSTASTLSGLSSPTLSSMPSPADATTSSTTISNIQSSPTIHSPTTMESSPPNTLEHRGGEGRASSMAIPKVVRPGSDTDDDNQVDDDANDSLRGSYVTASEGGPPTPSRSREEVDEVVGQPVEAVAGGYGLKGLMGKLGLSS